MKRKLGILLSFGLMLGGLAVVTPHRAEAKIDCVTLWSTKCESSQGACCYEGGNSCSQTICAS